MHMKDLIRVGASSDLEMRAQFWEYFSLQGVCPGSDTATVKKMTSTYLQASAFFILSEPSQSVRYHSLCNTSVSP